MPSCHKGVVAYWIATSEDEIHFIDAIIGAHDGLATVRREFELADGCARYKVYVSLGMEEEFLEVIERLRGCAQIGAVVRGDEDAPAEG